MFVVTQDGEMVVNLDSVRLVACIGNVVEAHFINPNGPEDYEILGSYKTREEAKKAMRWFYRRIATGQTCLKMI